MSPFVDCCGTSVYLNDIDLANTQYLGWISACAGGDMNLAIETQRALICRACVDGAYNELMFPQEIDRVWKLMAQNMGMFFQFCRDVCAGWIPAILPPSDSVLTGEVQTGIQKYVAVYTTLFSSPPTFWNNTDAIVKVVVKPVHRNATELYVHPDFIWETVRLLFVRKTDGFPLRCFYRFFVHGREITNWEDRSQLKNGDTVHFVPTFNGHRKKKLKNTQA
jgi:hypothetical protein